MMDGKERDLVKVKRIMPNPKGVFCFYAYARFIAHTTDGCQYFTYSRRNVVKRGAADRLRRAKTHCKRNCSRQRWKKVRWDIKLCVCVCTCCISHPKAPLKSRGFNAGLSTAADILTWLFRNSFTTLRTARSSSSDPSIKG